ncbi:MULTISPECIES: MurR/RpiR family transcriptional regulator [Atopobiaceae]|uniref:Transcriptional regulator, RpiR family n=1 Tax=Parafannyhessea umbonata TaxID=604330 RepID=A0A1H6IXT4_9ACTN|nr:MULTISPECIES: MurR/RpiR family transcriptional regulator [Atopobiaceae]SEH54344.1 transcriptional regulator, RpiR family [Parafannyhessea umbonata]SJZ46129.1 transcriptional regulator, RpiR family [Olsenella sp. KH1P3]
MPRSEEHDKMGWGPRGAGNPGGAERPTGGLVNEVRRVSQGRPGSKKSIAQFLLNEGSGVSSLAMGEVAQLSFTSKPSLVRFAQALGFSGWTDFSEAFAQEARDHEEASSIWPNVDPNFPFKGDTSATGTVRAIASLEQQAICEASQSLDVATLDEAARYVLEADDVAFFGIEQNYFQGQLFAYKLRQIGIDCVVPRREEAPLVAKGLGPGGCAVIVSYSGLSNQRPPSSYVEDLRERHVPTIGVTNSGNNWLRRNVDCALTFRPREHFVSKIASFYGERATNLVLDALFSRCFAAHYDANVRRKLSKVVAIERKLQVKDVLPE